MVTNEGLLCLLFNMVQAGAMGMKVRLTTTNIAEAVGRVIGDLTEATFPGYAAQDLSALTWSAGAMNGGGEAFSTSDPINWIRAAGGGGPETIYGLYVTLPAIGGGDQLWDYHLFGAPITITNPGDAVVKILTMKHDQY